MLALAKQLLADGVPLDGIGFQGHLIVGSVPTAIATQLSLFTALGLEVAVRPFPSGTALALRTNATVARRSRSSTFG